MQQAIEKLESQSAQIKAVILRNGKTNNTQSWEVSLRKVSLIWEQISEEIGCVMVKADGNFSD